VSTTPLVRALLAKKVLLRVDRRRSAYSVEKLSDRDRQKNPTALESLKSPRAEGTATFDDLRSQIRSVRHTSRFPRIFGRISIQLKNRFDPGNEFFNRIGQSRSLEAPGRPPKSGHWRAGAAPLVNRRSHAVLRFLPAPRQLFRRLPVQHRPVSRGASRPFRR
jgi:hypothetical protein